MFGQVPVNRGQNLPFCHQCSFLDVLHSGVPELAGPGSQFAGSVNDDWSCTLA